MLGVVVEIFLVIYSLLSLVQEQTDAWGGGGALIYLLISMMQVQTNAWGDGGALNYLLISMVQEQTDAEDDGGPLIYLLISMVQEQTDAGCGGGAVPGDGSDLGFRSGVPCGQLGSAGNTPRYSIPCAEFIFTQVLKQNI